MNLREAFRDQAGHCAKLDSPFMAQLLNVLADFWPDGSPLDQLLAGFTGDIGPKGASLPLRIAAGLHALVLTDQDADLKAVYPPAKASDDDLRKAVISALGAHEAFMIDWVASPPQTNEVRRSAALIAASHFAAREAGVSRLRLSELGASGGLNLMFDRFALQGNGWRIGPKDAALTLSPVWAGVSPIAGEIVVTDRRGVDLTPLDPKNDADALRLRAYLWADQPYRLTLTNAAITVQDGEVDQADAIAWLAHRLQTPMSGEMHIIYHTVAWQYFPETRQNQGQAMIEAAGARSTTDAPLAWISMEADNGDRGAALTLRLWPGDRRYELGRVDFHGRWLDWAPQEIA